VLENDPARIAGLILKRKPRSKLQLTRGRQSKQKAEGLTEVGCPGVSHEIVAEVRPVGDVVELAEETQVLYVTEPEELGNSSVKIECVITALRVNAVWSPTLCRIEP
jgi:hypothetical protein